MKSCFVVCRCVARLITPALLTVLAACNGKTPAPPAPAPASAPVASTAAASAAADSATLMRVLFGSTVRADDGYAIAELADPDNAGKRARFLVEPELAGSLPGGEALLVTNAEQVDDDGNSTSGHASSGLLSVFVFERKNGQWQVRERFENIATLGSDGHFGDARWVDLGQGRTGLAVDHGGMWQGYSITYLALLDVTAGRVRVLTTGIKTQSSNEGACEEPGPCWSVEAAVRYVAVPQPSAYPDIELTFSGRLPPDQPPPDEEEAASASSAEQQEASTAVASAAAPLVQPPGPPATGKALYRFNGKDYQLIKGNNIVPDI